MKINTDNPIIKFSGKGKPFQYDKLLYATLNEYILDYKNARLDKLTDQDASICLARIIRKMEVNDVPVQQFFHEELEKWSEHTNYEKILRLCELMAKDNDGERDYIVCDEVEKKGLFKKVPTPVTLYFNDLMEKNKRGELPKSK